MSHALLDRAVIRVSATAEGEDAAGFLQGLVTNDVTGMLPIYAGLLTPQGKTLFDFIVWPGANGALLLDCERAAADDLVRRLALYRLRRKLTIARDDTLGVFWQAELGDGGAPDPRLADLGQRWIAVVDGAGSATGRRCRLAQAPPVTRRARGPRGAGRRAVARDQCRGAERSQLLQRLLCRPGEHRADELAAEDQPPLGGGSAQTVRRRNGARQTIRSWVWPWITCGSTPFRPP